jgi:hypothetical protein
MKSDEALKPQGQSKRADIRRSYADILEAERTSYESLEQRLKNCEAMLAAAVNLIGAMQPVVRMAEAFVDHTVFGNTSYLGLSDAVAKYRAFLVTSHESHPQRKLA